MVRTLFLISLLPLWYLTFAGSAGVKNGTISGLVQDDSKNGLAGVNVVAVFQGEPPIIRQALSDGAGNYTLNNLRVGQYSLGFSKYGYQTISASASQNLTEGESSRIGGNNLKAYVESGAHFRVPPVVLRSLGSYGDASVVIRVIDALSGEPVQGAVVTAGNQSGAQGGTGYSLTLPIEPGQGGKPQAVQVTVPGFKPGSGEFLPVPGQLTEQTILLEPETVRIEGLIKLQNHAAANWFDQARITVDSLPADSLNASVDGAGHFQVSVPASTPTRTRFFNINIFVRGYYPITIPQVPAPVAGVTSISYTPALQPVTTPLAGAAQTKMGGNGRPSSVNHALIVELGVSQPIQFGRYSFEAVPVDTPLTMRIHLANEEGKLETVEKTFQATQNGTGVFVLPTLITGSSEN